MVRRRQRSLAKDILETGADMEDVNKTTFADKRSKNNEIYKEVNYAREAALDAENLVMISEKVSKQANKLVSAVRYDTDKVIRQLIKRSSFEGGGFDWEKLGKAAGRCFNMVPFTEFMNGPLKKEVKERKEKVSKKRVRVDEEAEEERPEEVLTQQKDKNSLSGMEDIIKSVNKTLKKTVERKTSSSSSSSSSSSKKRKTDPSSNPACVVKLVVNPQSFTQTAENILALSFQVKKGDIAVKTNKEGLPVAFPTGLRQQIPISKQSVLSLNMKQWREMIEEYDVKENDGVPLRSHGKKS